MAVKLIKNILASIIFVVFALALNVSCASESLKSKVIERATLKYKKAMSVYEKQLTFCEQKFNKKDLNKSIFKNIKLTQQQLQIAIFWFYNNARSKCENEKYGLFLIQRGLYRAVLKQYDIPLDTETPKYYDDYDLFGGRYKNIELELKYLSYPKKEREKLDKIPELKTLFRFLSIIKD